MLQTNVSRIYSLGRQASAAFLVPCNRIGSGVYLRNTHAPARSAFEIKLSAKTPTHQATLQNLDQDTSTKCERLKYNYRPHSRIPTTYFTFLIKLISISD